MNAKPYRIATAIILTAILIGLPSSVHAQLGMMAFQLYPGGNESDGVAAGQSTYNIFFDATYNYPDIEESVCLSSRSDTCTPTAIDDYLIIYINGKKVVDQRSYTQDFGPIDMSSFLATAFFQGAPTRIRVQLIDLGGPSRGGSALWLVGTNGKCIGQDCSPDVQIVIPTPLQELSSQSQVQATPSPVQPTNTPSGIAGLSPDFSDPQVCEGSAQLKGFETYKVAKLCEAIPNADDVNAILEKINQAADSNQCWQAVSEAIVNAVPAPPLPVLIPVPQADFFDSCYPVGTDISDIFNQLRTKQSQPSSENTPTQNSNVFQQVWNLITSLFGK